MNNKLPSTSRIDKTFKTINKKSVAILDNQKLVEMKARFSALISTLEQSDLKTKKEVFEDIEIVMEKRYNSFFKILNIFKKQNSEHLSEVFFNQFYDECTNRISLETIEIENKNKNLNAPIDDLKRDSLEALSTKLNTKESFLLLTATHGKRRSAADSISIINFIENLDKKATSKKVNQEQD
jgi:hypothetical protein